MIREGKGDQFFLTERLDKEILGSRGIMNHSYIDLSGFDHPLYGFFVIGSETELNQRMSSAKAREHRGQQTCR